MRIHSDKARHAAAVVGLACYWPYFRRFEFDQLFVGYADPALSWTAYTAVTLIIAAMLLGCIVRGRSAAAALSGHPALGAVAGALFAAGYVVIAAAPALVGPVGEKIALGAGCLLLGAGFCGLTAAWMSWLAVGARGRVIEDALASFALCSALALLSLLPPGAVFAFTVACPVVSGALWALVGHGAVAASRADGAGSCVAAGTGGTSGGPAALRPGGLSAPSLVAMCLLLLIGRVTAGLAHFDLGEIQLIERATQVVVSCIILGAIYASSRRTDGLAPMVRRAWLALVVVFLTGETVTVLADGVLREVGSAVFWASLSCFEVLTLAVVALWCRDAGRPSLSVMCAATLLLRVAPSWVGKFAVPATVSALGVDPSAAVAPFVLASSLVLMTATLLFMNAMVESRGGTAGAVLGADTGASAADGSAHAADTGLTDLVPAGAATPPDAAEALACRYLLTPRETDVLRLSLQGLSYQAIADRIDVSLGTVQSYMKGLYRKLDVHSRDELVERAEQAVGQGR